MLLAIVTTKSPHCEEIDQNLAIVITREEIEIGVTRGGTGIKITIEGTGTEEIAMMILTSLRVVGIGVEMGDIGLRVGRCVHEK